MNKTKSTAMVIALATLISVFTSVPGVAFAGPLGYKSLYWGTSGWEVTNLQNGLKSLGYNAGTTDGIYGNQTFTAVKKFQRDYGLIVDGVIGSYSRKILEGVMDQVSNSSQNTVSQSQKTVVSRGNNISREDLGLLARAVYSEARGESYEGQVAVAAVILNRLESPDFPNTIKEIIFEPWAFTAVNDGQFWLTPDETAYKAAQAAINGWDPTNGAVYYYNPANTTNKWIWSRPVTKQIGSHLFAK